MSGGGGRRTGRGAEPRAAARLSRQAIIEAAVRITEEEGLDGVSARRVAGALGVTPMALYRHVGGKDDILEAVVDSLLEELPVPAGDGWAAVMRSLGIGLRQMFLEHHAALELYLRRPITSPAAKERLRRALELLVADGFDHVSACRAYAAVHSYTVGFSALEAARARKAVDVGPEGEAHDDELAAVIRSFVSEGQFELGLDAMLRGMGPTRQSDPPRS